MSPLWSRVFRVFYWILSRMAPLVRPIAERWDIGNIVGLEVPGRRSGQSRRVLLGLLRVDGGWYLGHPNGASNWTRNLDAAGGGALRFAGGDPIPMSVELLEPGDERRHVIEATWHQHVFPGPILYWLARRHVMVAGRYYRVLLDEPG